MRKLTLSALALAAVALPAQAASVPGWLKLLHWISGNDRETTVPHHMMGPHMQMTTPASRAPGDRARAADIVAEARDVLARYPTVAAAERDGYKAFPSAGRMGEEVHYTSLRYAYAEGKQIDYAHPGSLLFQRTPQGLVPVGVMYSAPGNADADELDARAPRSIAPWHRHVDFCWALGRDADAKNAGPRFGYSGSIHDAATCTAEGAYFLPLAFGWMTHVYPGRADAWGGESMRPDSAGGGDGAMHDHHM